MTAVSTNFHFLTGRVGSRMVRDLEFIFDQLSPRSVAAPEIVPPVVAAPPPVDPTAADLREKTLNLWGDVSLRKPSPKGYDGGAP